MSSTANNYFKANLKALNKGDIHKARAKWDDGTEAFKKSIYQVFEHYPKGVVPLHTMRGTSLKMGIQEILWIYQDKSNRLEDAHKRGIFWWDGFDVGDGTIGYAYGKTVKDYKLLDDLLKDMENNPFSQRHVLSLWDKEYNDKQNKLGGLVPCAYKTEYAIVQKEGYRDVHMQLGLRSSDYVTAGAINRGQYFVHGLMVCGHLTKETGILHELGDFAVLSNDLHIYDRHYFAIDELLEKKPLGEVWEIKLKEPKNYYDYTLEDILITRPKGLAELSRPLEIAK